MENEYDRQFAWLIEADLKKHGISMLEFLQRPTTVKCGLRYKVYSKKDIIKKIQSYTDEDVNFYVDRKTN